MNGVDTFACLRNTPEAIAAGQPATRIDELLPWAYPARGDHLQMPQQGNRPNGGIALENWQQHLIPDPLERIGNGTPA